MALEDLKKLIASDEGETVEGNMRSKQKARTLKVWSDAFRRHQMRCSRMRSWSSTVA